MAGRPAGPALQAQRIHKNRRTSKSGFGFSPLILPARAAQTLSVITKIRIATTNAAARDRFTTIHNNRMAGHFSAHGTATIYSS